MPANIFNAKNRIIESLKARVGGRAASVNNGKSSYPYPRALAFILLLAPVFFSHSAYATSASISTSSQTVELNLVPSMTSTGSGVSNHTVNVKTDCSSGYNVYASATSSGDNKLHLDGNSSNTGATNSISASSNTMASPSSLSANTWGVGTSNSAFSGVPAYSELSTSDQSSNPTALYSSDNTDSGAGLVTGEDKTIYYSANVNTNIEPGSYSGEVLYTVIMKSACYGFTVNYDKNANDATGTMENQTISENTTTALTPNAYSRSGYTFRGWAKTISGPANFADKEEVIDLASAGETITLYAIWEPNTFASNTMQGFKCESLNPGETATLTDVRDNNTYTVLRLAESDTATSISGKCLMTENLKLGSNIASAGKTGDKIIVNPTTSNYDTDASNSSYESFTLSGTYNLTYVAPDDATSETYPADNTYSNHRFTYADTGDTYVYNTYGSYSWGTALVVCPAGWHLPTITEWGESTGLLGLIASTSTERAATLLGPVYKSPAYGGEFNSSGFNSAHTTSASDGISYWWSSTQKTNEYAHALRLTSTSALVEGQSKLFSKFVGRFVRCIQDAADGTMQSFNCSTLASGGTAVLRDERDNQLYGVYRIPTDSQASDVAGKCFMTDNLRLGMASGDNASGSDAAKSKVSASSNLTLRSSDSNFDTNASNSAYEEFTLSGDQTLTYVPSSTPSAWSDTKSYTNKQYTYGSGDYAFGYYSWGAALVACPSGWRLPIHTEYNNSTSWNKSTTGISYAADNSRATLMTSPWNFKYTGGLYPAGFNYQTTHGYYWSADQSSSDNAYFLILHTDGGTTLYEYSKYVGRAVRCIADEPEVVSMQSWLGCPSLSVGEIVTLEDTRDKTKYRIKKLADEKCWMIDNLTLGSKTTTGYTLTQSDTNLTTKFSFYLPPAGKQGTSASSLSDVSFTASNDNQSRVQYNSTYKSGYYNFYAATAGYSYYQSSGSGNGISQGSSQNDICPAGWRLPKTTDGGTNVTTVDRSNDLTYLALTYGSTGWSGTATGTNGYGYYATSSATDVRNGMLGDASDTSNGYAGFYYTGFYNSSGYVSGSYGYAWSSSIYNTSNGYNLNFTSSEVRPQHNNAGGKYLGFPVRCISKLDDGSTTEPAGFMQDYDTSNPASVGQIVTLVDKRDYQTYRVKKLADNKVWMIDNLTLGSKGGVVMTRANTNVASASNTYYLPPAGYQGSLTSSNTLVSTTVATFGYSGDNQGRVAYAAKGSTNNDTGNAVPEDTGYYNFYTATLGYSYWQSSGSGAGVSYGTSTQDICPAGWRLPITPNTTTQAVSSIGSDNDFTYLANSFGATNWSGASTASDYSASSSTNAYKGMVANSNNETSVGYAGFTFVGFYDANKLYSVGTKGYFWTRSIYAASFGYRLAISTSKILPQSGGDRKSFGFAVRCITK